MSSVGRWLGVGVLGLLLLASLLGPWLLSSGGVSGGVLQAELPAVEGRELLAWWVLATRNALGVAVGTTLLAAVIGITLGAASVYGGAAAGGLLFRLLEFLGAVPGVILAGVLRFADPSGGVISLVATLTLFRALELAQLVRAQVLETLPTDYVEASRALGASRRWQLRVHVLPRLARPLLVNLLVGMASLIGLEAALSFTGLGVPDHVPSWGNGLAVLAGADDWGALACLLASIGLASAAFYGLGAELARDLEAPLWPAAADSRGSSLARKAAGVKGIP